MGALCRLVAAFSSGLWTCGQFRLTLIYCGFFGELDLEVNLREAYKDFRAWRKANKIHSSQRIFRLGFASLIVWQILYVGLVRAGALLKASKVQALLAGCESGWLTSQDDSQGSQWKADRGMAFRVDPAGV